jgi:hypothetical protein
MTPRLHPRLGPAFARMLYEARRTMSLEQLRDVAATSDENQTWPAIGAPRISDAELQTFADRLRAEADALRWPDLPPDAITTQFDRRIARVLHEADHLFPAEAADPEMWSFVALVLVPDVTWWRWHRSTNVERFVASDLTRHTFAKQYWRAEALLRGASDPAAVWNLFDSLGEADFDQIQTRRRAYGVNPEVTRALARSRLRMKAAHNGADIREPWRKLLKSLLRLGAFVSFAVMSANELDAELITLEGDQRPGGDR